MKQTLSILVTIILLFAIVFVGCKKDSENQLTIQGVVHDSRQNIGINNANIKLSRQVLSDGTFNSNFQLVESLQSGSDGSFLFEFDRQNVIEYKLEATKTDYITRTIFINPDLVKPGEVFLEGIEMISLATVDVRLNNESPFDGDDTILFQNLNANYDCDCCDNSIITLDGTDVDTTLTCSLYGNTWHRYLYSVTKNAITNTVIDSIYCNALQANSFEINY